VIEALALTAGYLMGGTVGWGTLWFLVSIGPTVQIALRFLSVPYAPGEPVDGKLPEIRHTHASPERTGD
jgi:hypothetical protein